ncbi:hypothetical protein [Desulfoferrobacter suflitae]|uniref:hypothetical protein n=1 Tax=Desulfoferrobacter suflitae TaxID=2865782 RepID=UPI0021642E8E|nr:hypothetical protein [Desulfoferrobacter suflitae]MCK8601061.1 hypothetical protein [Desulfoferrobacter suflitae]
MATRVTRITLAFLILSSVGSFYSAPEVIAAEQIATTGWEKGSAYQKLYKPQNYQAFKGTVTEIIEVTPISGMAPGAGLLVRTRKGTEIPVHLGPKAFVDVSVIGLKKGDKVKVMGVFAGLAKDKFFIASKVKKGEFVQVKLRRTSDGMPFWAMSVRELAEFTAEFGPPSDAEKSRSGPRFFTTEPVKRMPQTPKKEFLDDKVR